jgi:hypothetical protein
MPIRPDFGIHFAAALMTLTGRAASDVVSF